MPSCPGFTPRLHFIIGLTAGSAEHSPLHQWKASMVDISTSRKLLSPSLGPYYQQLLFICVSIITWLEIVTWSKKKNKTTHTCLFLPPFVRFNFSKYGLPWWLSGKESACQCRDTRDVGSIPGSGTSPGGGNGNPFQYFCLENSMEREKCWAIIQGIQRAGHNWSEKEMLQIAFLYFKFNDHFSPAPACLELRR